MGSFLLTDDEVDIICAGLTTNAAKVRHLRGLGLNVNQKPNGRALVVRSHAEAVLSGRAETASHAHPAAEPFKPDREAYLKRFGRNTKPTGAGAKPSPRPHESNR